MDNTVTERPQMAATSDSGCGPKCPECLGGNVKFDAYTTIYFRDGDESRDSRTTWTAYNDVPGECEDCGHSEELGAFYPTGERNER